MSNTQRYWIIGVVVVAALAAIAWLLAGRTSVVFQVDQADRLSSWQLPPPQNLASAEPAVKADIAKLEGYLASSTISAADVYVGIGNDYLTLGDGQGAYRYYNKALAASSTDAVAYLNLGALFARLHATSTAIKAYQKAAAAAPTIELIEISYLQYLAQALPQSATTATAFGEASSTFGGDPNYLIVRAEWEGAVGNKQAAIADWRAVLPHAGAAQKPAIEAEIAALSK